LSQWEWEIYTPGPEVYEQLWHIRNEPATVTPFLPTESPIPHAQTRIKDRRQTEGDIQRVFYVVEITKFDARNGSMSSVEDEPPKHTETVDVDLSRILEYVSPDELERYENEQFTIEAEAEAAAMRAEAEEVAQRGLEKNIRVPGPGAGKGSRMLNGLGLDDQGRTRGRSRGRGKGRGRGRGQGSWRGRGALVLSSQLRNEDMREELVDVERDLALHREEDLQRMIAVTNSEDDMEEMETSPGLARSAFVANSALPVSPVASHRRLSGLPTIRRRQFEDAEEDSDLELEDADARSMSSAAMQLRLENDRGPTVSASEEEESDRDRHRSKRRRTESTASSQRIPIPHPHRAQSQPSFDTSIPELPSASKSESDESIPTQPPVPAQQPNGSNGHTHAPPPHEEGTDEDEDAEEYVVEVILEHFKEAGKKFYLVKWQGYEDSYDWLPEEDLEGAAELVAEYNAKVRSKQRKMGRG
jgi:hypothetical protein